MPAAGWGYIRIRIYTYTPPCMTWCCLVCPTIHSYVPHTLDELTEFVKVGWESGSHAGGGVGLRAADLQCDDVAMFSIPIGEHRHQGPPNPDQSRAKVRLTLHPNYPH
jgi:hypothetical protein